MNSIIILQMINDGKIEELRKKYQMRFLKNPLKNLEGQEPHKDMQQ